jgi:ABC-2 type transport system ATP-binding protein
MSGLLTPTAGGVTVGGFSITRDPLSVKKLIGVVPQELAIYPHLTARQNLAFSARCTVLAGPTQERIAEVLDFTELADRADDPVSEYSGGMKRRVNIGRAAATPQVLFLDEPTVAIDPQSRRNILDAVKALNEQGMTVLYTTHYMEEAQELSDRVGIIDHGEIIALGTQQELTQMVGEHDTLTLSVPGVTQDVIDKLCALDGVETCIQAGTNIADSSESEAAQNGELRLLAKNGRAVLPQVIETVNAAGLSLNALEVQEPTLEAVFLHLTGRALRD